MRLSASSARSGLICFKATSRCSSASNATETLPMPPWAWGRRTWNRIPVDVGVPRNRVSSTGLPCSASGWMLGSSASNSRSLQSPTTSAVLDCAEL